MKIPEIYGPENPPHFYAATTRGLQALALIASTGVDVSKRHLNTLDFFIGPGRYSGPADYRTFIQQIDRGYRLGKSTISDPKINIIVEKHVNRVAGLVRDEFLRIGDVNQEQSQMLVDYVEGDTRGVMLFDKQRVFMANWTETKNVPQELKLDDQLKITGFYFLPKLQFTGEEAIIKGIKGYNARAGITAAIRAIDVRDLAETVRTRGPHESITEVFRDSYLDHFVGSTAVAYNNISRDWVSMDGFQMGSLKYATDLIDPVLIGRLDEMRADIKRSVIETKRQYPYVEESAVPKIRKLAERVIGLARDYGSAFSGFNTATGFTNFAAAGLDNVTATGLNIATTGTGFDAIGGTPNFVGGFLSEMHDFLRQLTTEDKSQLRDEQNRIRLVDRLEAFHLYLAGRLAQVEAERALRQWQWRDTAGTSDENTRMGKFQDVLLGITSRIALIRGYAYNLYRDPDYVLKREFRYSHVSKKIRIGHETMDAIVVGMKEKGNKSKNVAFLFPTKIYYD